MQQGKDIPTWRYDGPVTSLPVLAEALLKWILAHHSRAKIEKVFRTNCPHESARLHKFEGSDIYIYFEGYSLPLVMCYHSETEWRLLSADEGKIETVKSLLASFTLR